MGVAFKPEQRRNRSTELRISRAESKISCHINRLRKCEGIPAALCNERRHTRNPPKGYFAEHGRKDLRQAEIALISPHANNRNTSIALAVPNFHHQYHRCPESEGGHCWVNSFLLAYARN